MLAVAAGSESSPLIWLTCIMASPPDPASLQSLLDEMANIVRRAFSDGYRYGTNEAIDRMTRAATFGAEGQLPNLLGPSPTLNGNRTSKRMSPPRVGLPGAPRNYEYGSVIGLCRQALLAAPGTGLTRTDFVVYCRNQGNDVTPNQVKDVIKRLIGSEEAERNDGLLYPGRRLKPFVKPDHNPNLFSPMDNEIEPEVLLKDRKGAH